MMKAVVVGLALVTVLAGCDPQQATDAAGRKLAARVVLPVIQTEMPTPVALRATDCIVQNADAEEVKALAKDIAVTAGSSTVATIRGIALRREASNCFAANGVPPLVQR